MNDPAANPYASPVADERPIMHAALQRSSLSAVLEWFGAVALNLPVPALFAAMLPANHQTGAGMIVGVLVVAAGGACLLKVAPVLGQLATRGGYLFALTQFLPIVQMMAGIVAISVVARLFGQPFLDDDDVGPYLEGFFPALLATLGTAGLLVAAAGVIGVLLRLATPADWWQDAPDATASEE